MLQIAVDYVHQELITMIFLEWWENRPLQSSSTHDSRLFSQVLFLQPLRTLSDSAIMPHQAPVRLTPNSHIRDLTKVL